MTAAPDPATVIAGLIARDPSVATLGIELVSVAPGGAVLQLTVQPEMCNGIGVCHGGLIFSLADTSIAFAANSTNQATVVVSAQIEFLDPARAGDRLVATSTLRWTHNRSALWDVVVAGSGERVVALAHGRTRALGTPIVAPVAEQRVE